MPDVQLTSEAVELNDSVASFLVPQTHTIRQAMEQLEKTEEKIVFVVDAESRLVGSLTDGDIRRWILSDGDSEGRGAAGLQLQPLCGQEGFAIERFAREMLNGNFGCVPVVNSSREVVRLVFWKELFQGEAQSEPKRHLNLPVVIMAGGQGPGSHPSPMFFPNHSSRWATGR